MSNEIAVPLSTEIPPAAGALREDDAPQAGTAAEAERSLTVQERRLQVARDINTKIDALETDIAQLSGAFGQSQETVKAAVAALQLRTQEIMADVLRTGARADENARRQTERLHALDGRLTQGMADLGQQLDRAGTVMHAQHERLQQLQERLETLTRLHAHLDKLSARQAQQLDALATDTHDQLRLLGTHVEGLSALYREQRSALLALSADHDLLAREAALTAGKLADLNATVTANIGHTRRRFRTIALATGLLAAVSLGLIGYFQLYPSAVPETVKSQLATLHTGLGQQQDSSDALRGAMTTMRNTLGATLADQSHQLGRQGHDVARLKAEAAKTSATLRRIEAQLAVLQAPEGTAAQ